MEDQIEIPEVIFKENIRNKLIFSILRSSGTGRRVLSLEGKPLLAFTYAARVRHVRLHNGTVKLD